MSNFREMKDEVSSSFNSHFHIVVTIAEHICDYVLKRVLKLSDYRLQIFLVKNYYLESLQLYETKFANMCIRSLRLIWRPGFKASDIFG